MKVPRGARYPKAPAIVEARLRPTHPTTGLSDAQYLAAMDTITATGRVPAGWELEGVRWGRFTVRGQETDAFRFVRWQGGEVVHLPGFPAHLFARAVVGIERLETTRTVEVVRWVTRTVRAWTGKWHSRRTGRYVAPAYAQRYPWLVRRDMATRRVRERIVRTVEVPAEEAVIRFTYAAQFTVSDVPEVGEEE